MDFKNLTKAELAKILGVAARTIERWVHDNKDGDFPLPSHPAKVAHGSRICTSDCYSLPEVISWRIEDAVRAALRKVDSTPEGHDKLQAAATLRKTLAEAETKELELARRKNELLEVADIERTWAGAFSRFRATLLGSRASLAEDVLRLEQLTFAAVTVAYDKVIFRALTELSELKSEDPADVVDVEIPIEAGTKRDYNLLFKSPDGHESHAQITAFEDSWHWGEQAEREFEEIVHGPNTELAQLIPALRSFLGENDLLAYLTMMANRLLELHNVLKLSGSLYLHCDPTASHYLKLVLDAVFGFENYRNEIIWQRTNVHSDSKTWSKVSDTIFFYSKSSNFTWNPIYGPHSDEYLAAKYNKSDPDGRVFRLDNMTSPNPRPNMMYEWNGYPSPTMGWRYSRETMAKLFAEGRIWCPEDKTKRPSLKRYLDDMAGTLLGNVWTDIPPINSQAQERLGYPTQKPLALLERIINASSNPGDVVLDPFCGCGTATHAAQKLGRHWIGIDITHLAISLIEKRLKDAFPKIDFEVHGTPKDVEGAQDLALRDKYQFQWWACSLVNAQPFGGQKKGADGGVDGVIFFGDVGPDGKKATQKIIVSVKGGDHVTVNMVRDLKGTVEREKAAIGVFLTLTPPTKPMKVEAAAGGFYRGVNGKQYPRIQILTIQDLLEGHQHPEFPDLSMGTLTFKAAKKEQTKGTGATPLFEDIS